MCLSFPAVVSERQESNLLSGYSPVSSVKTVLYRVKATLFKSVLLPIARPCGKAPNTLRSVVAVHPKITIITPHNLVIISAPYQVTASAMLAVKNSLPVSISFPSSKNISGLTGCARFYQPVFRDNALTQFVRYISMHQTCTAYRNGGIRTNNGPGFPIKLWHLFDSSRIRTDN